VRAFLRVEAAHLSAAFDIVRETYGSVERYLIEHLGVEAATLGRIEARLFEEPPMRQ
jgi:protein tyrosine/serine phosphatase